MIAVQRCQYSSSGGVRLSYLLADQTAGEGPLVVFCHGFPGLAYSWRHQLQAVAAAGYQAVALDMRGYGDSDAPSAITDYSLDHIRADLVALLDERACEQAVFVGHDFGAPVVWHMALAEPARVAGLVVLSVPYDFDYYGRRGRDRDDERPSEQFARIAQSQFLHAHYFQTPGVAERELDTHCGAFLRRLFWALSARGDLLSAFEQAPLTGGYLDVLPPVPQTLPWSWLTQTDFAVYADTFSRCGFGGALNWYRVADINWEINRCYLGKIIEQPVCFLAGERDPVLTMSGDQALSFMHSRLTDLRDCQVIPGAGHWVQQEQPAAVNARLLAFLGSL